MAEATKEAMSEKSAATQIKIETIAETQKADRSAFVDDSRHTGLLATTIIAYVNKAYMELCPDKLEDGSETTKEAETRAESGKFFSLLGEGTAREAWEKYSLEFVVNGKNNRSICKINEWLATPGIGRENDPKAQYTLFLVMKIIQGRGINVNDDVARYFQEVYKEEMPKNEFRSAIKAAMRAIELNRHEYSVTLRNVRLRGFLRTGQIQ